MDDSGTIGKIVFIQRQGLMTQQDSNSRSLKDSLAHEPGVVAEYKALTRRFGNLGEQDHTFMERVALLM